MIRPSRGAPTATLLITSSALGTSLGSLAVACGLVGTDPGTDRARTEKVCDDYFVATVQDLESDENKKRLEQQFEEWASNSLVVGLAQWQQDLG